MNGNDIAKSLGISTRAVGKLLLKGTVLAERKDGKWEVDQTSFAAFLSKNKARIDRLKREYIKQYRAGATVKFLQSCTKDDFASRGISYPVDGFAERTIYESIMKK